MTESNDAERADEEENRVGIEQLLGLSIGTEGVDERETYRIGDLAREFGVTLRTLRFYEDRGLLSPERRGTTRLYSRRDRMRLRLVLICKILGFSLTEAKQIIEIYYQPNGERKQIEFALSRMEEQRKILQEQEREIQQSLHAMDVTMNFVREREGRGSA
ncbi:MerR family transcriptional regulator [Aureimonas jatrophae]|uniref:DNA-binding transcriptional regulator, MerR family n=1 Tax=Aureimonas jatrophae TaxID=1166073 RepID=A0A1H0CFD0_9HYPH|nr:MerR family DNA-binding transcriptional regulator [Aureimonas jatrophae]MBB3949212.1 DNA-binding transcriptional MerR regulator [Aureimonas jatrophae]SDN56624.1 DNA-binding transcriptional regulator, MerR family [Aureimonas jatrophae]